MLASYDAPSVQTAVENLNLAQRQVEAQKAQRLSAEATLAQAKAQLHQAQVNLERTRVVSPIDGYVTNLQLIHRLPQAPDRTVHPAPRRKPASANEKRKGPVDRRKTRPLSWERRSAQSRHAFAF
jgi:hypothetical protein